MLLERLGRDDIAMFGAGQMAALLRCYAPQTWEKVALLLTDNIQDAWDLGKPVALYSSHKSSVGKRLVIVATAPNSQEKVALRLSQDEVAAIRFDDLVMR
jgi:hypothetical protein